MSLNIQVYILYTTKLYSPACLFFFYVNVINLQIVQNNTDLIQQDIPQLKLYVQNVYYKLFFS